MKRRDPADWDIYKEALKQFKTEIQEARTSSWRKFSGNIEGSKEAFRIHKILSRDRDNHLGSLKKPDGQYTTSTEDTLRHLMDIQFVRFVCGRGDSTPDKNVPNNLTPKTRIWLARWSSRTKYVRQLNRLNFSYPQDQMGSDQRCYRKAVRFCWKQ